MTPMNLDAIRAKAQAWTQEPYDPATRAVVQGMLDDTDTAPLLEAFHQDLAFGTGGKAILLDIIANGKRNSS